MASQSGLKSENFFLMLSVCRAKLLAQSLYQTCTQNLKENDPETLFWFDEIHHVLRHFLKEDLCVLGWSFANLALGAMEWLLMEV